MKIVDFTNTMNYNLSRKVSGKSELGQIQKSLIELFFKKPNLTEEEIKSFASNLYTNPNMFDGSIDYSSVKSVGEHFNVCLSNYKQLDHSKTM